MHVETLWHVFTLELLLLLLNGSHMLKVLEGPRTIAPMCSHLLVWYDAMTLWPLDVLESHKLMLTRDQNTPVVLLTPGHVLTVLIW